MMITWTWDILDFQVEHLILSDLKKNLQGWGVWFYCFIYGDNSHSKLHQIYRELVQSIYQFDSCIDGTISFVFSCFLYQFLKAYEGTRHFLELLGNLLPKMIPYGLIAALRKSVTIPRSLGFAIAKTVGQRCISWFAIKWTIGFVDIHCIVPKGEMLIHGPLNSPQEGGYTNNGLPAVIVL